MSLVEYLRDNHSSLTQAYFSSKNRDYFINVVSVLTGINCVEYSNDDMLSNVVITDTKSDVLLNDLTEKFSVIHISGDDIKFISKEEGMELDLFEGEKFMREYMKSKKLIL